MRGEIPALSNAGGLVIAIDSAPGAERGNKIKIVKEVNSAIAIEVGRTIRPDRQDRGTTFRILA
jgi:nitrate reductase NapAB chaperone NapD